MERYWHVEHEKTSGRMLPLGVGDSFASAMTTADLATVGWTSGDRTGSDLTPRDWSSGEVTTGDSSTDGWICGEWTGSELPTSAWSGGEMTTGDLTTAGRTSGNWTSGDGAWDLDGAVFEDAV